MSQLKKITTGILVLLNTLFAFALAGSCYGSQLANGKYWFIAVLSLFSLFFLAAIVLFFITWLFVKPRFALISIIAIAVCWKPIQHIFQFRINNDFNNKKNGRTIRVMSWNVEHFNMLQYRKHPERKSEMIDFINEVNPDIACFQEMVAGEDRKKCINTIAEFKRKFSFPSSYYVYDTTFDFDQNHHFGIIIYSKYPIVKMQRVVSDPTEYNSIFQYVDVVKNNDTFRVFNIHLQSLRFTDANRKYIDNPGITGENDWEATKNILIKYKTGMEKRQRQSDFIKKTLDESPYPVILCGDFNDVPNSYAYNRIGEGLNNAFTSLGSGISNTYDGLSPTLRIDNIFADKNFNIVQYNRFVKKLSDHFPIVADLVYNKTN
jgi:endonuclease/exonuclease/phosphatase family metal-dependent hydrolase